MNSVTNSYRSTTIGLVTPTRHIDMRGKMGEVRLMTEEERAKRMNELALKGHCCTPVMVQVALDELGAQNEQMVEAVSVLCFGLAQGGSCGGLAGAKMAMALRSSRPLDDEVVDRLVEWFRAEYGSLACKDIVLDPFDRFLKCPELMNRTYGVAMRLLRDRGTLLS